jgi:hypothetical protein
VARLAVAATALIFAYVIQAALGMPITLFLARGGRLSLGWMLVIGILCRALSFAIAYSPAGGRREASTLVFASIGAVFGAAIAAATYALVRGRRRSGVIGQSPPIRPSKAAIAERC